MREHFDAIWLATREPFDHRARSRALAHQLSAVLPARPRVLDLGAGTGSLFRFLAPIIGRAQAWTLVDADAALLGEAFHETADWAERMGWTVTWPGRALLVHTPRGAWRVEGLVEDLSDIAAIASLARTDAVVCSALLDLVSAAWVQDLAGALRSPMLACLSPDGHAAWLPRHPGDAVVASGFSRDQHRDKGFGPALGAAAPAALVRALRARRFRTRAAPSDWRVPRTATQMAMALTVGAANAAANAWPGKRETIAAWELARLQQVRRARLAIRIGHRDILALPG